MAQFCKNLCLKHRFRHLFYTTMQTIFGGIIFGKDTIKQINRAYEKGYRKRRGTTAIA